MTMTIAMNRRHANATLLAAALGLTLTGAGSASAATPKDTLVVAMAFDDIISLDPAEAFEISAGEMLGNLYDRLLRLDPKDPSKLQPDVAKSWSVAADGKTYTFELKPGLKFASGNPISAEDVAWSLQRAVQLNKTPAFILNQLGLTKDKVAERVKATGPLTLVLQTERPLAPTLVLNCLSANVAAVLDKKLLLSKETGGDMGLPWLKTHYAGSGPYKLRDWRANEILAMERNEQSATKAPLARVIYRHVKEPATQRLLLEKGDIDVARNLGPQDLDALAANKDIRTTSTAQGTVFYLSMNMQHPAFAKPEVREAMKYLVDYAGLGGTLVRHIGRMHQNFMPVGLLGASTEQPFKLDVDKAKALLAKAGYPNGFKATLDMRSVQPVLGIAESFQQTARRAGVQIEIIPGDGKQTLTKYRARKHDMFIGQWGTDYWDPHSNADTFARNPDNGDEASAKTLAWRNSWDIPELTKKADAAMLERDAKKRTAMYQEIQAEFRKASPFIMLYQQTDVAAHRANVEGLLLGPTADTSYLFTVSKR